MTQTPAMPSWFPQSVDAEIVTGLSMAMMKLAKGSGLGREAYAVAVVQMAEALAGFDAGDDLDGEVLLFIAQRLRATADAIVASLN